MQTVLLVIHLMLAIALIGTVLLQKSEGGALGMGGGGMSGFMTGRSTANLLTRTTAIIAGLFFLTSVLLVVLATHRGEGTLSLPASAPPAVPGQTAPTPPASAPTAPAPGSTQPATPPAAGPTAPPTPAAPPPPAEPTAPVTK